MSPAAIYKFDNLANPLIFHSLLLFILLLIQANCLETFLPLPSPFHFKTMKIDKGKKAATDMIVIRQNFSIFHLKRYTVNIHE